MQTRQLHARYGDDTWSHPYSNEKMVSGIVIRTQIVTHTDDKAHANYFNNGWLTEVETLHQATTTPETM
ncbi:MAG TPA: hypothetical protein VF708_05610 [Pyrinomonadaceae bacterium]